jgi:hypothetical protein
MTRTPGTGLQISSEPTGAEVWIDGILEGLTPLDILPVVLGPVHIRLHRDGYQDRELHIRLEENTRLDIHFELQKESGSVRIEALFPTGLEPAVRAYLNGELKEGLNFEEVPGYHDLVLEAFGWERAQRRVLIEANKETLLQIEMKPAQFSVSTPVLRRNPINPHDAGLNGSAVVNFSVSAPGSGSLSVLDTYGVHIRELALDGFISETQQAVWDGRDTEGRIMGDGNYTLILRLYDIEMTTQSEHRLAVRLDSRAHARPANLIGQAPGLLFCPAADLLPALLFQQELLLSIESRPEGDSGYSTMALGLSATPIKNLRISARALSKELDSIIYWAIGGSVAWSLALGDFSLAPTVSYTWSAEANPPIPTAQAGFELAAPIQYNHTFWYARVSPQFLWNGPNGLPSSALPDIGASAGVGLRIYGFNAGLSAKALYCFQRHSEFALGLEFRWTPASGILVLSASGGAWSQWSQWNIFAAASIGMLL